MVLDSLGSQIGVALAGGVAAEMLHWYGLARRPGAIAKYLFRAIYWVTTLGMVGLGGMMPVLYIDGSASALLCFHLGAATPVIVQKLVAAVPSATTHLGPGESGSLRDFFRW